MYFLYIFFGCYANHSRDTRIKIVFMHFFHTRVTLHSLCSGVSSLCHNAAKTGKNNILVAKAQNLLLYLQNVKVPRTFPRPLLQHIVIFANLVKNVHRCTI